MIVIKLACHCRKCSNVPVCKALRVGSVSTCAAEVLFSSSGCSRVALLLAFSLRAERLAADVMLSFCHTFRLCSWCHRPRLLDTQTVNEEKGTKTACRAGNAQRTLVPFRFVLCLTFWSVTFFFFSSERRWRSHLCCVVILFAEEELLTPPLNGLILPGVTRKSLLDLAREWVSLRNGVQQFCVYSF